jgi:hypothetical protein
MSNFSFWQPAYGERGIATFPVSMKNGQKKPAIRGWQHVDLRASAKLAKQFPDADAFGLCPGSRSRLTILDVDTTDEQVLSDALGQHGNTPIIVRTGSRHYQAWYRNNGESRRIRPFAGKPIDVLGAGFVVVPPSRGAKSSYQFIEGGLDDIGRLPVIQGLTGTCPLPSVKRVSVGMGVRNSTLFALCMQAAHHHVAFADRWFPRGKRHRTWAARREQHVFAERACRPRRRTVEIKRIRRLEPTCHDRNQADPAARADVP